MIRVTLVLIATTLSVVLLYAAFQILFLTTVEINYVDAGCFSLMALFIGAALVLVVQSLRKRVPSRSLVAVAILGSAAFGFAVLVRNWGELTDRMWSGAGIVGAVVGWVWIDRKLRRATVLPEK